MIATPTPLIIPLPDGALLEVTPASQYGPLALTLIGHGERCSVDLEPETVRRVIVALGKTGRPTCGRVRRSQEQAMEQAIAFAGRLHQKRLERGWSHTDLARQIGCGDHSTIRWEAMPCPTIPRPDLRARLAAVLDVTPEWLFDGKAVLGEAVGDE